MSILYIYVAFSIYLAFSEYLKDLWYNMLSLFLLFLVWDYHFCEETAYKKVTVQKDSFIFFFLALSQYPGFPYMVLFRSYTTLAGLEPVNAIIFQGNSLQGRTWYNTRLLPLSFCLFLAILVFCKKVLIAKCIAGMSSS